ncbi:hypothetical protein M128_3355 [Bacteroides fragilis str. S6L8]|nr:hypothetical protein M128_3355 [Bacteroides fragilis str. S6L8]
MYGSLISSGCGVLRTLPAALPVSDMFDMLRLRTHLTVLT